MNFRTLTHDDAGNDVTPRTREEWDEWVSATKLRGYLLKNTLGDWLELYGEANGFRRDDTRPEGYDERLDFLPLHRGPGRRVRRRGGRLPCQP